MIREIHIPRMPTFEEVTSVRLPERTVKREIAVLEEEIRLKNDQILGLQNDVKILGWQLEKAKEIHEATEAGVRRANILIGELNRNRPARFALWVARQLRRLPWRS